MIKKRRRFKQTTSLEQRISDFAVQLRAQAESLPPGLERSLLRKRILCAEEAQHLNNLLKTPDSTAPEHGVQAVLSRRVRR